MAAISLLPSLRAPRPSLRGGHTMWRAMCVTGFTHLLALIVAAAAVGPNSALQTALEMDATDGDAGTCCRREQHFVRVGFGEWEPVTGGGAPHPGDGDCAVLGPISVAFKPALLLASRTPAW